jgi:two-component system C4-dicarboxylate transport response regulator DctD
MPERGKVLFVDDEAVMRQAVTQWLDLAGFEPIAHDRAGPAIALLNSDFPGILVTDLKMEGIDGIELLKRAQQIDPELPVIVITGHGDVETAVEAMRLGAYDFIEKPFAPERFLEVIKHACEKRSLINENRRLRQAVNEQTLGRRIVGTSPAIERVRASVAELAAAEVSVILYGETGVGKDLVARCLHDFGPRKDAHYVAINCAAIPETMAESELFGYDTGAFTGAAKARAGKLEHGSGGTFFLDEIDSMPLVIQSKLLRALQERTIERLGSNRSIPVDVRAIAASKIDLRKASSEGKFRSDLYYRLSVVELAIPPLRERKEDIPLLFEYFASLAAEAHGRERRPLSAGTMNAIMSHEWPGNVRELRNAAERYALGLGGSFVSQPLAAERSLAQQVEAFERSLIERTLAEAGGRLTEVMERLGLPRRTLSEKMARYGLDRRDFVDQHRPDSANEKQSIGGKSPV